MHSDSDDSQHPFHLSSARSNKSHRQPNKSGLELPQLLQTNSLAFNQYSSIKPLSPRISPPLLDNYNEPTPEPLHKFEHPKVKQDEHIQKLFSKISKMNKDNTGPSKEKKKQSTMLIT